MDPKLTTSIYIPSSPNHYRYILGIIEAYMNTDVKPDEIVIGPIILSEQDKQTLKFLEYIINQKYDNVKIFPYQGYLEAGPNRQRARFLCNGDIVLYQDADDLPHPERVYWIKTLFEAFPDTMVINHSYVSMGEKLPKELSQPKNILTSETLRTMYFPNNQLEDAKRFRCYGERIPTNIPVHAGAVCIRPEVLEQIYWKKMDQQIIAPKIPLELYKGAYSEDMEFCFECLYKLNRSIIIDSPLYFYRR